MAESLPSEYDHLDARLPVSRCPTTTVRIFFKILETNANPNSSSLTRLALRRAVRPSGRVGGGLSGEAGGRVVMSMRVMSAGSGYRYLLDSVAVADADRPLSYYTAEGTPPGRWLGTGLRSLNGGGPRLKSQVSEYQLRLLFGEGRDPGSGLALGRAYGTGPSRRAVAGFDLTFSAPKSVSVLWAMSSAGVQRRIWEAHHRAVDDVLRLFEWEVAATRIGAGGVAQVGVDGILAAAFDHYDSRTGDPQLHTHVIVSNKVPTSGDGRWRALDSRPVHAAVVALSEHYNAVLADHLTAALGVAWAVRDRGPDRNEGMEIVGIPEGLLTEFSGRSSAIGRGKDLLIEGYVATHGRRPTATTIIRLRQQATLATRPAKTVRSLADLTGSWRERAGRVLGVEVGAWTRDLLAGPSGRGMLVLPAPPLRVAQVAARVVEMVGDRRSTWHHWNIHAEASRQLRTVRFTGPQDREAVTDAVVAAAEARSVSLEPPEVASTPAVMRRPDGSSVLRPRHATRYTSHELLGAEAQLLERSRDITGPSVAGHVAVTIAELPDVEGRRLGADQAAAVVEVAASGRELDLLVGPAGTGKTTALAGLRRVWESTHGAGSVVGLAPSAAAAHILGEELGIGTENTAKWLHDQQRGAAGLRRGQLVIVDEASLDGTRALQCIAANAHEVGAKVLLVGDPGQLAAVDAGGAFALLVGDSEDVAELSEVRRFHQPWEAHATVQLRRGDPAVLDTYVTHGRVREGEQEEMVESAYAAWRTDVAEGQSSLLIAPTREITTALNQRARADLIGDRTVDPVEEVALRDGTAASVGDQIITRRNARTLYAGRRWVRNGDRWTVAATHADGSLTVRHPDGPAVRLPAAYVTAHVELGYATTVHRAQGATVDSAHAIATPTMAREQLYVAMTRGREANTVHVATDRGEEAHQATPRSGRDALAAVLARSGAEQTATAQMRDAQDQAVSLRQLLAEYQAISQTATLRQRPQGPPQIAGILHSAHSDQPDVQAALDERERLIEQQAVILARAAFEEKEPWVSQLVRPGQTRAEVARWQQGVSTIAAYRALHGITGARPLGDERRGPIDAGRVQTALQPPTPQPAEYRPSRGGLTGPHRDL